MLFRSHIFLLTVTHFSLECLISVDIWFFKGKRGIFYVYLRKGHRFFFSHEGLFFSKDAIFLFDGLKKEKNVTQNLNLKHSMKLDTLMGRLKV